MQNNNKNLSWGIILLILGFILLGNNLDWFDISFRSVARFWPLMLIFAGVNVILSKRGSGTRSLTALFIALAVPMAIFSGVSRGVDRVKDEIEEGFSDGFEHNSDGSRHYDDDDSSHTNQKYNVGMKPEIKEASLRFSGGAGEFDLEQSTENLFDADTDLSEGSYTLSHDESNNSVEFKMKGNKKIKFDTKEGLNIDLDDDFDNRVKMRLNTLPLWNLKFEIGAGSTDLDLSNFKVKDLDLSIGAAAAEIKLGDKAERSDIKIESGVASVKIQVPRTAGCEIKMDGALNSKDFDGFQKIGGGVYRTAGFDKASKKIYLEVESGLSSLEVDRY